MDGVGGLLGWQWLFIIEGAVPVILGVVAMALLPDHPSTCRWLSAEEKAICAARVPLHSNAAASHSSPIVWADVGALFLSPVMWAFALLNVSTNIASYGCVPPAI